MFFWVHSWNTATFSCLPDSYALASGYKQVLGLLGEVGFLFPFFHFAMWNADVIAGALAAILNSEDEGYT